MLVQIPPRGGSLTPTKKIITRQLSFNFPKLSFYFLTTSTTILILIQVQALKLFQLPFSNSQSPSYPPPPFLPLKNLNLIDTAMDGTTWFMSSFNDTQPPGEPKHLYFPSKEFDNRLLCIYGHDASNGTRNGYALFPHDSLPPNSRLLPGLTFVSDTYFDHLNLFHGLTAVMSFVAWHERRGCAMPARWVLYHQGELRKRMSPWVGSVAKAVFGENTDVENFEEGGEDKTSCFEKAAVIRHSEGAMSKERKQEVFEMIRCKAREYCNITREVGEERAIRVTLLLRTGARSFRDDAAVTRIFDRECKKVEGCRLKITSPNNLTFCDQVGLMSSTDVLASPHGAQLTNMFFMDKNSSVMEFFPRGWLELAGPGQYVYQWIALSSGMRHKGAWRDPDGEQCPDASNSSKCFAFYKNGTIGYDEKHLSKWAAEVIREMKEYKLSRTRQQQESSDVCQCS